MFFKIDVVKNFAIFARKHLYWSYFLIKLQAWRSAILLKRDSNTGVFLWNWEIFKNTYFEEHLRTAAFVLLIIKLVARHLFFIKNMAWDGFFSQSKTWRGMVSTKKVCRSGQIIFFTNYSRNHSNTFLLLDLQKIRSKAKNRSSDIMILAGLGRLLSTALSKFLTFS